MPPFLPLHAVRMPDLTVAAERLSLVEAGIRGSETAWQTMKEAVAEPTSPSSLSLLSDLIERGNADSGRSGEILSRLAEEKGVLGVIARLQQESMAESLRERPWGEPPSPLHREDAALDPDGSASSRQTPWSSLPEPLQKQALQLIRMSAPARFEFASLSGGLMGRPVAATQAITSRHGREIDGDLAFLDFAIRDLYEQMIRTLNDLGAWEADRASVVLLHTHPLVFGNHSDGRYFTYLSLGDLSVAGRCGRIVAERLHDAGFRGALEVFIGAIPVPFRPWSDDLANHLYVALYRREIP